MPEEFDLSNLDVNDPEAIKRLREYAERQAARANKAEESEATMRAAARTAELKGVLDKLKAPGQLAELYPADKPVTEDDVRSFLRDKVGLTPDQNDAWSRYEKVSSQATPPPPEKDQDQQWYEKEMAEAAKFYSKTTQPSQAEIDALEEAKMKVFSKLNQWDQECASGQREVLVSPQGYGGFLDPPPYARRARHYVSSAAS